MLEAVVIGTTCVLSTTVVVDVVAEVFVIGADVVSTTEVKSGVSLSVVLISTAVVSTGADAVVVLVMLVFGS